MKYALLITTYNSTKMRNTMYTSIINWYLKNTNITIFVVDSYNAGFDNIECSDQKRLFIHKFDQNTYKLHHKSSTTCEIISIKEAFANFCFNEFDYIFKLTGKYAIPELENYLDKFEISDTPDLILQYRAVSKHKAQNSEIFGISVLEHERILSLLESFPARVALECRLFNIMENDDVKYLKLRKLIPLESLSYKRNCGDCLYYL